MDQGERYGKHILVKGVVEEVMLKLYQIKFQPVPPFQPLLAGMPSGREYHTPKQYKPPTLDDDVLASMRRQPDPSQNAFTGDEDDSGDEGRIAGDPIGAFPGTARQYEARNPYY